MLRCLFFSFLLFSVSYLVYGAYAQELPSLSGVAVNARIADELANDGDIVSITKDGLIRSKEAYDSNLFGVIVAAPILSFEPKAENTRSVVTSGQAQVKVNTSAGKIKVGDLITSSSKEGVGQKASDSGFVLGRALVNYEDESKDGIIPVEVAITFSQASAVGRLDSLVGLIGKNLANPIAFAAYVRYALAAIVALLTFLGGAFAFIRFMNTGLEAIGRNPLAKRTIIAGMVMSGTLVLLLAVLGFGAAFAIIVVGR